MPSNHGPQFDVFNAQSGEHHGGAQFDEFHGGPTARIDSDAYGDGRKPTAHPAWDEFGWKQMPHKYGAQMDSDFREAVDGSDDHGTWHDVFRGAQVRAIVNGHDIEATIINTHDDHAIAETRDGRKVELGLTQVKEWRRLEDCGSPSRREVDRGGVNPLNRPANDAWPLSRSSAEAPSAHDAKASGGHLPQAHKTEAIADDVIAKSVDWLRAAIVE